MSARSSRRTPSPRSRPAATAPPTRYGWTATSTACGPRSPRSAGGVPDHVHRAPPHERDRKPASGGESTQAAHARGRTARWRRARPRADHIGAAQPAPNRCAEDARIHACRQVISSVGWHATTIAVIALVVGLPLGAVAGRLAWQAISNSLGVATVQSLPLLAIATIAGLALLVANIAAFACQACRRRVRDRLDAARAHDVSVAADGDRIDDQLLSDNSVSLGDVLIPGSGGAAATLLRSSTGDHPRGRSKSEHDSQNPSFQRGDAWRRLSLLRRNHRRARKW